MNHALSVSEYATAAHGNRVNQRGAAFVCHDPQVAPVHPDGRAVARSGVPWFRCLGYASPIRAHTWQGRRPVPHGRTSSRQSIAKVNNDR